MEPAVPNKLIGERVFGGYVITGLLGTGGMGAVYVAEHQGLGKKMAVKVLHDHMTANRVIVTRFLAEARAASALDHPNIVKVIDSATLGTGADYIALEFLDGSGLDQYCKGHGRLGADDALRILAQISCGLEAAHRKGIVHRDLKLANIQVAPTTLNRLHIKILDFGIAKLMDPALAGDFETKTNAVAGTPGYMAPEQARGMKAVDHRADLYALGCIAYRMLTAKMPFAGDALGEIIYQQLIGEPPGLLGFRPDLPDEWGDVIHQALSPEPAERPRDATEFAMTLARSLPQGLAIVNEVAPLFFSQEWMDRTKRHLRDVPVHEQRTAAASADPVALAAQTPHGVTATYGFASPTATYGAASPTTLSPAAQFSINKPAKSSLRLKLWIGIVAGTGAVALAVSLAVIGGDEQSSKISPDGSVVSSAERTAQSETLGALNDAGVVATLQDSDGFVTTVDASIDAAPERVTEEKERGYGQVRLSIRPFAEVYVRGRRYPNAPSTIRLREGSHRIKLVNKVLGKSDSVRLRVRPGKTVTIRRDWH